MPHSEVCMMFHIYCVDRENRPITGVTIFWPETNKTFVIPSHFSRYWWIVENDHCEIEGAIKEVRGLETTFFVYYLVHKMSATNLDPTNPEFFCRFYLTFFLLLMGSKLSCLVK